MMGFEQNVILGWEGFERGSAKEKQSVWKNCHIYSIKMEKHIFRGLDSRDISRKTHWSFREKLLVAKQSR